MSIRVDETKPDIEATEPAIPTTCSPEDLPDEELLYDLADLFKVFSDTTRIKILYASWAASSAWQTSPKRPKPRSPRCRTSCAHSSSRTWLNSGATGAISYTRSPTITSTPCSTRHEPYLRIATNHGTSAACTQAAKTGKGTHHEKQYKLDEIDCANCARELQDELAKLEGVKSVSVNFMTQKLTLEADDAEFDECSTAL